MRYPYLSPGQLFDFALDHAGIPDNGFGTRWLLIEDGSIRRVLTRFSEEPGGPGGSGPTGPQPGNRIPRA